MRFVFLILVELNCSRLNSSFACFSFSFHKWLNLKLWKKCDISLNICLLIQYKYLLNLTVTLAQNCIINKVITQSLMSNRREGEDNLMVKVIR